MLAKVFEACAINGHIGDGFRKSRKCRVKLVKV